MTRVGCDVEEGETGTDRCRSPNIYRGSDYDVDCIYLSCWISGVKLGKLCLAARMAEMAGNRGAILGEN